ncbi:MAG: DnaJ domain-containing protein [Clostridiales bacterium]|nr:DnaJ domain-containing protein [Clostridiales bacterium]
MNQNNDFYQVLQIGFNAEKADIISAYRRLSKLYHPDVSGLPHAQELMSQINIAYDTLSDDMKRQAYNNSLGQRASQSVAGAAKEAKNVITEYFTLLAQCDYEKAFRLLSASDRQRVGIRGFTEWRQAVHGLYAIREFNIRQGQYVAGFKLENGRIVTAIKFFVDVLEKDMASHRMEHYCFNKYVVFEQGQPGVYLGYRDLGEISKTFGSRAREREQDLMQQTWQKHLQHNDRITGLLTREGLLAESRPELYRVHRYKRPLTVAVLSLKPARLPGESLSLPCLDSAAQALKKALRITDIPAHLGNGVFVVLFFELKKRHAALIVERALKKAEQGARSLCKDGLSAAFAFEQYLSGPLESCIDRLTERLEKS